MKCKNCKHEGKYHANSEAHVLKTSHCTKMGCDCKHFSQEDK